MPDCGMCVEVIIILQENNISLHMHVYLLSKGCQNIFDSRIFTWQTFLSCSGNFRIWTKPYQIRTNKTKPYKFHNFDQFQFTRLPSYFDSLYLPTLYLIFPHAIICLNKGVPLSRLFESGL